MIKVGLTGGVATGKATVAGFFKRLGALIVDADRIAHEAILPGTKAWGELVNAFGRFILKSNGRIDRRRLASIVFEDGDKVKRLNSIVWPPVIKEMGRRLEIAEREGRHKVIVANVPLLFEAGLKGEFDKIIVVTCHRDEQIRRCSKRDGLTKKEIESRIKLQLPMEEKIKRADYVITNASSLEDAEKQVNEIWNELMLLKEDRGR